MRDIVKDHTYAHLIEDIIRYWLTLRLCYIMSHTEINKKRMYMYHTRVEKKNQQLNIIDCSRKKTWNANIFTRTYNLRPSTVFPRFIALNESAAFTRVVCMVQQNQEL